MPRKIKLTEKSNVEPCPQCGNKIEFTVHSEQVCEDGCELWAACKCGYDPSEDDSGNRLEDVWGGTNDANCLAAMSVWNDLILETKQA